MQFRGLLWRVLIPLEVVILVATAGLAWGLSEMARRTYLADLETQLTSDARLIADALAPVMASGMPAESLDGTARRYASLLDARVTLIGPDGTVWGESHEDRARMDNHLGRPEVQEALNAGKGTSIRYSHTVRYDMMYVAVPVTLEGRVVGIARVSLPLRRIEANVARLHRTVWGAAGGVALLIGLLALLRITPTIRAVRDLNDAVRRMTAGDLGGRVLPRTDDEVGDLTRSFNQMAERLERTVAELDEERTRLTGLLNRMSDGVIITDGAGVVRLINPAAARLLNVPEMEAMGRSFAQVVWDHRLVELWRQSREQSREQVGLIEMGPRRPVFHAVVTPLEENAVLVLLQDLTRLRELETVRRDFVSNVSHELRTPLATLKALVETLQEGALEDPPAARRFLEHIGAEVDRLDKLVGELLDLARIESGRAPMRMALVAVAEVVQPPVERLRPLAEQAGLPLTVHLPPDLPPVLADVEQMQRVVANLVHNAIQFTPAGEITVHAERVGDEVVISVRDTGVGIPAEDLPRVFERFYKRGQGRWGGGAGLGLSIARHIVRAHGGRIWAESVEGQGSTFYVALPVAG